MLKLFAPNIGQLKSKGDVKGLFKAMAKSKDAKVRQSVIEALKEFDDEQVMGAAIAMFDENDSTLYGQAVLFLTTIGSPALASLITALMDGNEQVRKGVVYTLGEIADSRTVGPLIVTLSDESHDVRRLAAISLGKIGDVQAIAPLEKALNDEYDVAGGAAGALLKLQPPDSETKKVLDAINNIHVKTINADKMDENVSKLIAAISLHIDLYPHSKEFFIRRALELAISPDVEERIKSFLFLSLWESHDSRAAKAWKSVSIPKSAL